MAKEIIKQIIKNISNGQMLVYLPKSMNLQEGDYVKIVSYNHPMKERLERYKKEGKIIKITTGRNEVRKGKITGFVHQGVMLDTGCFVEFDAIVFINEIYPEDYCYSEEEEYLPSSPTQEINEEIIKEAELSNQIIKAELEIVK